MSTTDSSTQNTTQLKDRWSIALGKLHVLGRLLPVMSLRKGLEVEDDLARRDAEAYHKLLHGDRAGEPEKADDMGDIILGDRIVNQTIPQPVPSGGFVKGLIGAGLIATGVGGPFGAWLLANAINHTPPVVAPVVSPEPQPPKVETRTETKVIDWSVGQPIVE